MTQLDVDLLQSLLYFFGGGAVLILVLLITYIVVASRRKRMGSGGVARATYNYPEDPPDVERVMSLFRAGPGGRLLVEVGETRYQKLSSVADPEIKRKIVAAAMELIQFTGVLDGQPIAPAPVEETQTWREDLREGSRVELERARGISPATSGLHPSATPQQVEEKFLGLLTEMGQTSRPRDYSSVLDSLQHRLQPKLPEPQRARTFVDEIDDILQRRVQLTPALVGRDLHVQPVPGGRVRFSFEGLHYDSVEAIPNLTARQLIKDSIQEWDETT